MVTFLFAFSFCRDVKIKLKCFYAKFLSWIVSLDHDVYEHFGPVGEHTADIVPVEAVEKVAAVLEVDCQWVRVEPVVDPLGIIVTHIS